MIQGSASRGEAGAGAIASPVVLLEAGATGLTPKEFLIKAIGRCLNPEGATLLRDSRSCLPPEEPAEGEERPESGKRGPAANFHEGKQRPSWAGGQILSPLHLLKPIFVSRRQPHICLVTDDPGVQKVDEVGVSPVHRKRLSCL